MTGPVVVLVEKVALTVLAADIVTVHVVLTPEHAPPQPLKLDPFAGAAVSVTEVPTVYDSLQSLLQLIPEGLEVTVPEPLRLTLNEKVVGVPGAGAGDGEEAPEDEFVVVTSPPPPQAVSTAQKTVTISSARVFELMPAVAIFTVRLLEYIYRLRSFGMNQFMGRVDVECKKRLSNQTFARAVPMDGEHRKDRIFWEFSGVIFVV